MRKSVRFVLAGLVALASPASAAPADDLPAAIYTDPPRDTAHPARLEVVHVPTAGVKVNGVAYLAAGAGAHPTVVLCHGWPGNEKNLDLAQAIRRAGWNVVTFNYRGSWGSPGRFAFRQAPEDAKAVLAYLRDPQVAAKLGIDPDRLVIAGHSMGGWVSAMVAGDDKALKGAILISAANMGLLGKMPRAALVAEAASDMEPLAGVTAESMADELTAGQTAFDFLSKAPGLASTPLLILSSDDGLAPMTDALGDAVRQAGGGERIAMAHAATDHSWSDRRVELAARIITWLNGLK